MNAKSNPQKRSNKESSVAMIPKIMSGMTPTKSTDNVSLNLVNILVKSEEELGISSVKTTQSNIYKRKESNGLLIQSTTDQIERKDINGSLIQSTTNQIGLCDTSILYKDNVSDTETQDLKPDLELHQPNTDSQKISNSDNVSNLKIKDVVSCSDIHSLSQNEMTNEQKPINSIAMPSAQPRRRGRPRKYVCIQTPEESNYYQQSRVSNSETSSYGTKNSMNTTVISTDNKPLNSNIKADVVGSDYIPKRRGRPPSKNKSILKNEVKIPAKKEMDVDVNDTEHLLRLAKSSIVSNENSRLNAEEQDEMQVVRCVKCGKEITKKLWAAHNLMKHNNMAWYEGEESMDFQDIKLLKRVLSNAIKKKKGQLTCEQCGATKRSVNGFISHIQFCGKSDDERRALMVTCSACNAVMMPSSMEIHERHHRELKYNKRKHFSMESMENEKVRRKAAEKAVSKILQFTEFVKEECLGQPKKVELNSSVMKNVKTPELKKKIPSAWKTVWKKELESLGIAKCRQLGCNFSCSSYEEMSEHCSTCNFVPQENFICKLCKFFTPNKEEVIEHMKAKHESEDNTDNSPDFKKEENPTDESDDELLTDKNKQQSHFMHSEKEKSCGIMMFLDDSQALRVSWAKCYTPTLHWTMEFERENYDLQLFDDYLPNSFVLLNSTDTVQYLPPLKVSMPTKTVTLNSSGKVKDAESEWKYWNIFEGGISQDCPTFFAGGPVWALAWLPIPASIYFKKPDQYLAVSTHPDMENEYSIGKAYSGHNIIQIWNMGKLNNELNTTVTSPTLSYAIIHNSSTIWSLEWCPSGCYQDDNLNNCKNETNRLKRMGLLAAAASDGSVYIYSLPFPEEVAFQQTKTTNLPIYKTDPVVTLVVNSIIYNSGKQDWQCTKLSWTKERGHNTIAAGFTNGYIALWDLTEYSPLLIQKQNKFLVINAFLHFFAHSSAISMLAIIPYSNKRFLASGSLDRCYKLWDLENTGTAQESVKKGIITDGAWMLHWPGAVIGFDDALGYKHTNTYLIPLREYGYKLCPILATNSPTYTVAISDYANSIAHGSLAGEIVTVFPHQLLYTKDVEKILPKKRQLNSFVKVIDLKESLKDATNTHKENSKEKKSSKDYHYMPETYNESKDRFGIIFHNNFAGVTDNLSRDIQQKVLYADNLTCVPVEQYPFMSVNKIAWNPNTWSHLWLAAGYQNGLVRLLNFAFMSPKLEMDTIVKEHAEAMLKKQMKTNNT